MYTIIHNLLCGLPNIAALLYIYVLKIKTVKLVNWIKFWVKWSILGEYGFKGISKEFFTLASLADFRFLN